MKIIHSLILLKNNTKKNKQNDEIIEYLKQKISEHKNELQDQINACKKEFADNNCNKFLDFDCDKQSNMNKYENNMYINKNCEYQVSLPYDTITDEDLIYIIENHKKKKRYYKPELEFAFWSPKDKQRYISENEWILKKQKTLINIHQRRSSLGRQRYDNEYGWIVKIQNDLETLNL
jgi:hypothetical protein